jgi:small GTP-binding protein
MDDDPLSPPPELKIVVIGVSGVGKTSICVRYVHGEFQDFISPTIGASFLQKIVRIQNYPLCMQIWDTAGQERFRAMTPLYYRNSKAAIVVFDASDDQSFHKAKRCVHELRKHVPGDIVMTLCANKVDLMGRMTPSKLDSKLTEAVEFAKLHQMAFFHTSAKDNMGIKDMFRDVGRRLLKKHIVERENQLLQMRNRIDSESNPFYREQADSYARVKLNAESNRKGGCC